jgi:aquaporin Z
VDQATTKRLAAELIGTFWLVFGGCGTAVFAIITRAEGKLTVGLVGVSLAFGLTVVTGAYAFGHISGGHFNPAVTLGLVAGKRFAAKDAPAYIGAQIVGGILAAGAIWTIANGVPGGFTNTTPGNLASNGYGPDRGFYDLGAVLFAEALLTFVFLLVIMGATHKKAAAGFAGLAIGLALTLIHLISIPISNTSVNPARSIGPAIFEGGDALTQLWAFIVAPIVGAVLAGLVYAWMAPNNADATA